MSFTSPTEQFKSYQAFGSGSSSSKPPAQSFSSRVDFSDQSYDMPYFAGSDVSVSNPQTASTASKHFVADVPRGFTPKQLSDAPKTKSFDKKRLSSIPNTSQQARPSQPPTAKIDYTEFLESLEFPSIADSKICQGSGDLGTSQWLVQEALFAKWRTSNGLLWLRGSQGSGKSTLMKQALESCQGPNSIHLTYSFLPSGDEARTRLALFKSLIRQLIPQVPEAFKGIKERFDKIQSCLPPKQQVAWNAQELFDELIKVIPKILRTHSVCIYVDGINYSEGETGPKLVQDFSKLVEKSQIPTKDPTTTHGLRIIFSSTPHPMKDPFPRSCIQVDEKNGPSLRKHLEAQLSNIDLNTQRLVSTKAGSSFISARLIVNHIKLFGPGQSSLVQQPSPTPAPVSFLLGAYFQDMAHQGSNGLPSLFKWCCLSSRPLSLPELRVALALDALPKVVSIKELSKAEYLTRFGSDESFQSWIKTTSWGLLEVVTVGGEKVVKPMHDSVSDFFISKGLDILSYKAQSAGATASPLHQAHHSIATCLLRYLTILSKEPRWESMSCTDPALRLVGYAVSWSYHITSADLGKPEASKLLKVLGWPSGQTLNVLVKLGVGDLQGTLWTHLFTMYGHAHFLSVAVRKAGNDVLDVQDRQKRTPLHLATLHGHSTVTKQLLKSGAKTNGQTVGGDTALHFAVLQGHQSIMKYLLERDPNLITVADGQSHTPLFSAVFRGSSSAVKLLLDRRADLRALDTYGNSVLHHAVKTEKSSVIKLLLDSGSDVNGQNVQGRTPLHLAIVGGHSSVVKALLERRSRTDIADKLGRRALHEAVLSGDKACTQLLLKHRVAVDARDNDGQTALVYAIQGRHGSLLKLLLEGGTDINAMDKYGFTMIMVAVQASDEKLTRILLEKNPDLDRLSREGHTVAFYAVFRGKAVSFLSEEEQSIASLLFRRYQKRYQVWHPEWKECQQEFMAKHGKKKDASSSMKSKAKPSKVKSAHLPSKNYAAPKSRRLSKVPSNIAPKTPISASQPRADELERPQAAQGPPKPAPQNEVAGKSQGQSQTQIQSQNRPQATANTSAPLAPSNPMPKVSTGVQGNQISIPSNSMTASGKPGMQQIRPVSSFASCQPPRVPSGSESGSALDAKAKEQSSKPPQAPYPDGSSSTSAPAKAPMVQRGSWDIYSSLASGSPAPTQTVQSQKSYVPYPGTPQTSPGASPAPAQSFQTFQPFPAGQAQKTSSSTGPVPLSQFEKRYSVPSLNSWGQPGSSSSASASPARQNTPAQPYQAFGAASQKPNMSQQHINAPYQKPANPVAAAKPPRPQVVRKPVGGKPVVPAEKPTQQYSFLPWQQPQAPSGAKSPPVPMQAQAGTTQSWPSKPQAPPSETQPTPGKQGASGPVPYLSSKAPAFSTGTSQPAFTKDQVHTATAQAPLGKPQAQGGMPPRKPQAAPGVVQPQMNKPQGQTQTHPPSGKTASVPSKTHTPPGATQPQFVKPQAQPQAQIGKPAPVPPKSQTPTGVVKPQAAKPQAQNGKAEPQAHKMQGPPGTSQIPSGKPQGQGGLPSQKPQVPPSKVESQPAKPSFQSGTSAQKQPAAPRPSVVAPAKYSATPTQTQKTTPDQKKPVSSHTGSGPQSAKSPTGIPVQGSSGQKPHQYIDKNSTISSVPHYPESFYRGQYGEQTHTSTFTSTREFTNSYDPNTQQTGTSSMSSSKMAAAAGVGVLAGAAGGYFLSSEIREDHSNPSITDDNSYIHMDAGMSQQPTYDSDAELETHVEFSDHSEEFSESENEANSINDSGSDGFLSDEEYELSDSEVSVGQASSDDEISEWGESDAESIHEDSDSDEFDLDIPYMSADFTDSEASEAEDLDAHDLQAESGSDLDTDPGQASAEDSESEEKESVNNESGDELDESAQSMGFQQQNYIDQQYQKHGYLNEPYQQPIPEEHEYEEHVQPNSQPQYQQQGYFNGQYQQQVAQHSDSEEDEPQGIHQQYQQQGYYNQHNQVAEQTESEEDELQNFDTQKQEQYQGSYGSHPQDQAPEQSESEEEPYQQQYQQQGYHSGQHQQQVIQLYDSEDEEGHQAAQGSVNYDSDQEVESDQEVNNGYSSDEQDQQATDGQYSGGGWGNNHDSDY